MKNLAALAIVIVAALAAASMPACASLSPEEKNKIRIMVLAEYDEILSADQKQKIMDIQFSNEEELRKAAAALADKNRLSGEVSLTRDKNIRRINASIKAAEEYFAAVKKTLEAVNDYKKCGAGSRAVLEKEIMDSAAEARRLEKAAAELLAEAKNLIDVTPLNMEQREDYITRRSIILEHMPLHSELLREVLAEFEALRQR